MTKDIEEMLKGWEKNPAATQELIDGTQQLIGYEFPEDLLELMRAMNGGHGYLGLNEKGESCSWLLLEPVEEWPRLTNNHGFIERKLMQIGSDGGACAYCLSLRSWPMEYLRVDYISYEREYCGRSLLEFFATRRDRAQPARPAKSSPVVKPKPIPAPPKDKPSRTLQGAPDIIVAMALSPDGERLATSTRNGVSLVFDLATGQALPASEQGDDCAQPAVGWVGQRPLVCRYNQAPPSEGGGEVTYAFRVVDLLSGQEVSRWRSDIGHGAGARGAFSPDGSRLIFTAPHCTQHFVDVATGRKVMNLLSPSNHALAIAWAADSSLVALGRRSGVTPFDWDGSAGRAPAAPPWAVLLLDRAGREVGQIKCDDGKTEHPSIRGCQFDARERLLVVRTTEVRIFQTRGGRPSAEPIATIKVPLRTIETACFVGDERLAVTTAEGMIVLFDLASGKQIRVWQSVKNQLRLLQATADGKLLLTANGYEVYSATHAESKAVRVWKVDD